MPAARSTGLALDLIGTGRLAAAFAAWVGQRRPPLPRSPRARPLGPVKTAPRLGTLVSRDPRRARRLARRWGAGQGVALAAYRPAAPVILLAVPDDALAPLAAALARRAAGANAGRSPWQGKIVLHASGLQPASALAPLRRRGAAIGSLHPLMTFGAGRPAPPPGDLVFAVEGQPAAVRAARQLVAHWGGRVLALHAAEKPLYHLAATWASPLVAVNIAIAAAMLQRAGLRGRRLAVARIGLARLLTQTAANLAAAAPAGGLASAWTGPIARDDRQTIRRQLAAAGEWAPLYRAMIRAARRELGPSR